MYDNHRKKIKKKAVEHDTYCEPRHILCILLTQ